MRDDELPGPEEVAEETWSQRIKSYLESLGSLLSTRAAIFREELGVKAGALGRAAVAFFLAATFAWLSLLLLTAGIAALLSRLFGSPIAGILVTFVLFAAAAALAGYLGVKSLSRGNLLEFPVTGEEIRKDWRTITRAAVPEPPPSDGGEGETAVAAVPSSSDDLEARFRVGSE